MRPLAGSLLPLLPPVTAVLDAAAGWHKTGTRLYGQLSSAAVPLLDAALHAVVPKDATNVTIQHTLVVNPAGACPALPCPLACPVAPC